MRHQWRYNNQPPYVGNQQSPYVGNQQPPYVGNQLIPYIGNQQLPNVGNQQPLYAGNQQPFYSGNQQPHIVYLVSTPMNPQAYDSQVPLMNPALTMITPTEQDMKKDQENGENIDSNSKNSELVPLAPDDRYSEADRESYRERHSNSSRDQLNLPINQRNTSRIVPNSYEDQSSHGLI